MERRQHQNLQNEGFSAVGNHSMRDGLGSNREAGTLNRAASHMAKSRQKIYNRPPLLLLGNLDHLQIGFEFFARLYIFNLHLNIQLDRRR